MKTPEEQLEMMIALAALAHANQKRKNGEPYFNHLERVANRVNNITLQTIAYGHDLLEDTEVTYIQLLNMGFDPIIRDTIEILTRIKGETYFDFIRRIVGSRNFWAYTIKLADLADNLSDLEEGSMKDKYRFAQEYIERQVNFEWQRFLT